jgi:ethanolamine-phosphate cytidylyltransferase
MTLNDWVPQPGQWPVDPQEDEPVSKDRIWLDGCFDFSHHGEDKAIRRRRSSRLTQKGHAGAMLQARRLGTELLVGIHSDEDILENKGPTVMTLQERCVALQELERSV